ncbi:MAG: Spy/CpxP family protein refolding chaperone [Pyrinomonadaceae bacterium]
MKLKSSSYFAALVAVFAFSAIGFAQETKTTQNGTPSQSMERGTGRFGREGRMHGRHDEGREGKMLRAFSELNLTDSQKQQVKSIVEANKTSTQTQRDELRQLMMTQQGGTSLTPEQDTRASELKMQLHQAGKKMNDDLIVILTPEQQQQLRQKRDEMRQKMQERRQMKQQNGDTTPPPQNN